MLSAGVEKDPQPPSDVTKTLALVTKIAKRWTAFPIATSFFRSLLEEEAEHQAHLVQLLDLGFSQYCSGVRSTDQPLMCSRSGDMHPARLRCHRFCCIESRKQRLHAGMGLGGQQRIGEPFSPSVNPR